MDSIETISWRMRVGNRFTKSLSPAMDSEAGYVATTKVRRTGDAMARVFNIVYDRSYLVEYIGRIICRPLFSFGKEKVIALVDEAWENYYNSDQSANQRIATTE